MDVVEQLTKTMEGLKSKYESAISTVNALTETVDDQEQALKTQKDKYRSLRNRKERKEAKMQQSLDAADEKIEMEETELSSTKLDLKRARKKNKMLKEKMEAQATEFRTKAEEAEQLIESYKTERDETVHNLEVSNAKLRNMIDHSHLAASAFAKIVNERAYYKNLSEKAVEEGAEEGGKLVLSMVPNQRVLRQVPRLLVQKAERKASGSRSREVVQRPDPNQRVRRQVQLLVQKVQVAVDILQMLDPNQRVRRQVPRHDEEDFKTFVLSVDR